MSHNRPYKVGRWLPSDQRHLEAFMQNLVGLAKDESLQLHPVIIFVQMHGE